MAQCKGVCLRNRFNGVPHCGSKLRSQEALQRINMQDREELREKWKVYLIVTEDCLSVVLEQLVASPKVSKGICLFIPVKTLPLSVL